MIKRSLVLTLSVLQLCVSILGASQPGFLDPSFQTGGGTNGEVIAIARQKDGKVLLAGSFTSVQGTPRNRVCRLLSTGLVDTSFNPGLGADGSVNALALQLDGKIVIGGSFSSYNGTSRATLARLNVDGSLDPTFDPGTGANSAVFALAIQTDGKVLVGGGFSLFNNSVRNCIARVNADGAVDTTYLPAAGASGAINAMAIQTDDKVLIGGIFTSYQGTPRGHVARINTDATLDTTFTHTTGASSTVNAVFVDKAGKVLIGGSFTTYDTASRGRVARLNADGSLDTTFAPGTAANGVVNAVMAQADGKLLIGGGFTTFNGTGRSRIARLNADGTLDIAFDPGLGASATVNALATVPGNKVVLAGQFVTVNGVGRNRVAQLNANGSLYVKFNAGAGVNGEISSVAVQADGKVLIAGFFTSYGGVSRNHIARVNTDGTLDTTFNPGEAANGNVAVVALQADGKAVLGGSFTTYTTFASSRIVRLNLDGSMDLSFNPDTGFNGDVAAITFQPDGKMLVGGYFTSYRSTAINRIVRIESNGLIDASFDPGTGPDNAVKTIAVLPSGQVLIGGLFSNYNTVARSFLARLSSTGTLDAGFVPVLNGSVSSLAMQVDGKALLGGTFTLSGGLSRNRVVRLNTDASVDAGFDPGVGANLDVEALMLQPDGRVVLGGNFTSYDGTAINRLARVNSDGSLDASFNPGAGANSSVKALAFQSDNKVIVGGDFTNYDGRAVDFLARVRLGYAHVATTFTGTTQSAEVADALLLGRTTISLSKTGSFTGNLDNGTERLAFSGGFDLEGKTVISATRKNKSVVLLTLALTRGSAGGATITGEVVDYSGRRALLETHPPFFSSGLRPANHFNGKYHLALQAPAPGAFVGNLPPSGAGYLTFDVGLGGVVKIAGKAADGTALTTTVNLSQSEQVLLHFPLYGGKGFINGVLTIDDTVFTPARRPVSGSLLWLRPSSVTYPAGFNVTLTANGSQYLAKGKTLPAFGGTAVDSITATIAGGHLVVVGADSSDLNFDLKGKAVISAGTLTNLKITVNRALGTFAGSFLPSGALKATTIQGVITDPTFARGFSLVKIGNVILPSTVTLEVVTP